MKPLKSAKKAVKELDEEDRAFQEKKRAGMHNPDLRAPSASHTTTRYRC